MRKIFLFLLSVQFIFSTNVVAQQQYLSPLDIPLVLSANFGELRPNHFHSGIDLKTMSVINKPVYSIADGYISRISVSPSGYGLAIYVSHPNGQTSVYGHLNKYAPKVAEYVKRKQYEKESFSIDISVDKKELPVKKGDLIAYSGNSGSSAGPHVHFEIRDTNSQLALDPLVYYKNQIEDLLPPVVKGIAVYPVEGKGAVDSSRFPARRRVQLQKNGDYTPIKDTIHAWGKVGAGICTNDRMDGTSHIYGVKKVRLFCDNKEVFSFDIVDVNLSNTRMINSLIDFDYWSDKRVFYMKSFVEPGNKLSIYKTVNNGYIDINEERNYNLRYELEDLHGNTINYTFCITGKRQNYPQLRKCTQKMGWDQDNKYNSADFSLEIPKGYLYDDLCFMLKQTKSAKYLSDVFEVNDCNTPLNNYCEMSIKINRDSVRNKSQYGVVIVNGTSEKWIGGTYKNGIVTTKIRELGNNYAVTTDTKAPSIEQIFAKKGKGKKAVVAPLTEIRIKLTDNKSGIASYRGTIDGAFALFENDVKSSIYTYKFDPQRLKKGQTHKLVFTATDGCGNTASYEYEFKY